MATFGADATSKRVFGFFGRNRGLGRLSVLSALLLATTTPQALAAGEENPDSASSEVVVVQAMHMSGPDLSASGSSDYSITSSDISALPAGENTSLTDILTQMPGVAIDQNAQIHIRNTEGPQFQYQINGVLIPLDVNTNPPFLSMINPLFISRLDLLTGVLPSRYSYATGGVVDIQTIDGCEQPGGSATIYAGQRDMLQPSVEYAGCSGSLSYFGSLLYSQNNLAFSSATPGPDAIHDRQNEGQGFGLLSYPINSETKISLLASVSDSDNQLPNVPGLPPEFTLAGASVIPSSQINSYLNFRDYLGVLSLSGTPSSELSYQLSYSMHSISEIFEPDDVGELIYQGVASTASHKDFDNTVQGDLTYILGHHTIGTGFYFGSYDVTADDTSLVFPVDASGNQSSDIPLRIVNNDEAVNTVTGLYVNDLWNIDSQLRANFGLRWDHLTGFTRGDAVDPTVNLTWTPAQGTDIHAGFARYMQVPSFLGISPNAPAAFAGTTAEGPPGIVTPVVENDSEWDVGVVHTLMPGLTVSEDNFYEITKHYLDTGQFGDVPIFAPFNYNSGFIWGVEAAVAYKMDSFSAYTNVTIGRNWQKGVDTGQFNFDPDELTYIDTHSILLDHQPLLGIAAGASYDWKPWSFSVDSTYSSGLQAGFADLVHLPNVFQVNVGIGRTFDIPGVGTVSDRLTLLNIFDRTNLIRPSEGIGIFQSAYEPRFTVFDALTIPL
ncbi:MAG TPA: TonB-dependent receptor [Rhizomicrobium sp.]